MPAENSWPDRIDLQHINVRGLCREQLLVESQPLVRPVRGRDDGDQVSLLARPFVCCRTAELQLFADGTAGNSDLRSLRRSERRKNTGNSEDQTDLTATC